MNTDQALSIYAALEAAVRAGFAVEFRPGTSGGVVVDVKPEVVTSGTASARVKRFAVAREHLRDAAGNALCTVVMELGLDRKLVTREAEASCEAGVDAGRARASGGAG